MRGKTAAPSGTCSRASLMSASRDGGDDGQRVAVLDGGLEGVEVADVLVVEVDVDEALELALVEEPVDDAGALPAQVVEDGLHGGPGGLDLRLVAGVLPHRRRNLYTHGHGESSRSCLARFCEPRLNGQTRAVSRGPARTASNSSSRVPISTGCWSTSATASCVFRPLPVTHNTISSSRGSRPCSISLRATATVVPPAVSAKMPSVWASSAMHSL